MSPTLYFTFYTIQNPPFLLYDGDCCMSSDNSERHSLEVSYLLHRVVYKAEVLRPSYDRSRDKVSLD